MKITRKALYEALWSIPRKELASSWRIDANVITAISKQQNIPLPKSGHWTLVSMGRSPAPAALTGDPEAIVTLEDKPPKLQKRKPASDNPKTPEQTALTAERIATRPSEPVSTNQKLVTSISEALPTIRKAYKTYSSQKAERDYKYQHVLPGSTDVIRIAVMPEMVERALMIMDAILREFQKRHWKIHTPSPTDRSKNSIVIDDVEILFTIAEHRRQERVKSEDQWRDWEYRYHSTGTLRFPFGTRSWMHEIKDNKRKKLEAQIPEIIDGILGAVARVKQAESDRNNRERIEQLESRLSSLVRKAFDYNHQCEQRLNHYIAQYEEARRIRSFIDAMRGTDCPEQSSTEREHWLTWLERKADAIDPAKNQSPLDFSVPESLVSQVSSMIESNLEAYSPLKELGLEAAIEKAVRWIDLQQSWRQK